MLMLMMVEWRKRSDSSAAGDEEDGEDGGLVRSVVGGIAAWSVVLDG